MTCIVGLVDDGRVWVGGDSAGGSGWSIEMRADPKVFRVCSYALGFTTSFRMGQLLRWSLSVPPPFAHVSIEQFMATTFVDEVRRCLKDGGFAKKAGEQEEGGTFLVGVAGHLFAIDSDYQVAEFTAPYAAVGCGAAYALGAMFVLEGQDLVEPAEKVRTALSAAVRHAGAVRPPFPIVVTDPVG